MALYTTNNRRLNQIIHSSKSSTYAVGLITLFITVLIIFLAILPAYKSITDEIANNKVKTQYLQDLNAKKDAMNQLEQQYNDNSTLIDVFNKYNLTRNDNELIIANLEKIAQNFGVQLSNTSFSATAAPTAAPFNGIVNLNTQPYSYELKGTLTNLHSFLAYIETLPIIMNINTISYNHGTTTAGVAGVTVSEDPTFTMDLSGVYYFWNVSQ